MDHNLDVLATWEQRARDMERTTNRLIEENRDLREQVVELKLEIERLTNGR